MKVSFWISALGLAASATMLISFSASLRAQGVDSATRPDSPADSWPLYHGTYDGQRHTRLNQITPQKVGALAPAWSYQTSYSIYFARPADGTYGWAGADYSLWGRGGPEAINHQTGKLRWTHEVGKGTPSAGVLTTGSGLTFAGDVEGNFVALTTSTGKTIWHTGSGARIGASPISYELHGRQCILIGSGGMLAAFALPQGNGSR